MGVCSQMVPYISFMGQMLSNHAFVNLTLVGSDSSNSVICHTDLSTCCSGAQGPHRGDWYFPNGTRLPFPGQGDIYENRLDQQVDLKRRNSAEEPSGIYRCDITTTSSLLDRESVYIGLYSSGGGIYLKVAI